MRKFYQTEWQNIPFSSFHSMSSTTLAGPEFYDAFYRILFDKYSDYDALDLDWRRNKGEIADWLVASLPDGARVLSIGCGLGTWSNACGDFMVIVLRSMCRIMPRKLCNG